MSEQPLKPISIPEGSSDEVVDAIGSLERDARESHAALLIALQKQAAEEIASKAVPIEE